MEKYKSSTLIPMLVEPLAGMLNSNEETRLVFVDYQNNRVWTLTDACGVGAQCVRPADEEIRQAVLYTLDSTEELPPEVPNFAMDEWAKLTQQIYDKEYRGLSDKKE